MGIFDKIKEKLGDYLLSVGVKRAAGALTGALLGVLTQAKVAAALQAGGVSYDPAKLQEGVILGVTAGVTFIHDFLRTKYPKLKL